MLHPIVLGTAGHIDHGKTSLVRALTGIDTDRLPIEKARGITTELGFARLDLGERRVAVVDVPGHERFVKSMVAGATGLDLVCLVIAADEGVMPQTREHLDICQLLGVRRGLVVLTKIDLVEDDWLEMVTGEVRRTLADTFLGGAPICAVSTRSERGLDALRATLAATIDQLPPRPAGGVLRMPIDRVFTVKGFGTIATGTILGGAVAVGDELTVLPSGLTARVRGLEVHGDAVDRAIAGYRCAINLGGIARDQLARGDLLVHPERVVASHILDVDLHYLAAAPAPLPARSKVLLHHGTAQVQATLALVEQRELAPGGHAIAQLRIDATTPLGALPGDRFIVRGFAATRTHGTTIGGGEVIRVLAPRARKAGTHAQAVAQLIAARGLTERIALDIRAAAFAGLTPGDLVRRLGVSPEATRAPIEHLIASRDILAVGDGEHQHLLHGEAVAELERRILAAVATAPEGVAREALRTQLPAALPARTYDAVLAGLEARGAISCVGERVARAAVGSVTAPALSTVEARLADQLERWAVEPLRPKDIPAALQLTEPQVKTALERLVTAKLAVKIKPDLYMHARVVDDLRARLLAFLDRNKTIDAQQWKDLTGASRKFTIPLAEFFDAEKLTLRVGDVRRRR